VHVRIVRTLGEKTTASSFFARYFITLRYKKIVIEQARTAAFTCGNILKFDRKREVYTVRVGFEKTYRL